MTPIPAPTLLREVPLFHNLSPDELATVSRLLHRRGFPPGSLILTAEQPGDTAYLVATGTVKVHVDQEDGSEVILAILGPGEVVGEMSLVDSLGRSASAVTLEESVLYWIDRTSFWDCLRTMTPMTYSLARILSRRLRVANEQIRSLATQDVHGRLARQLLVFAHEYGEPAPGGGTVIPFRLTQTALAGLVGASRVRVNQVLVAWKRRGYFRASADHRITLLDREALARFVLAG